MELELCHLVIHKEAYEPESLLSPWEAVVDPGLSVLLPTRLGHLFLEHAKGAVWFLNTWSGELTKVCESYEQFHTRIAHDKQFISDYLMPQLVAALLESGRRAEGDACYSPAVSPSIGGSFDPENFVLMSLRAHVATTAAEYRAVHGG